MFVFALYSKRVLNVDISISTLGIIKWDLALILVAIWLITFVATRKNITFAANSTFCLAILPPMAMGLLFLKSLFLEGAKDGLQHFLSPTWDGISEAKVRQTVRLRFHSFLMIVLFLGLALCGWSMLPLLRWVH